MKAIAVIPGMKNSVHLAELPKPELSAVPNGRGVLVRVLRVGVEVPADRLNLDFVLGNRVMVGSVNAGREYFEAGVRDISHAESAYPGWLASLLTHPVRGLECYGELFAKLASPDGAIKIFCEVAPL